MSVRKRGEHYDCEFTVDGKRYAFTFNGKKGQPLITSERKAILREEELRREVLTGTFIKESDLKNFTKFFDEVYMDYSKQHKTPKAQEFDQYYAGHLKAAFGKRRLGEITPRAIEQFIGEKLKTKSMYDKPFSPVTVRHMYSLLNQIFRMAIRERVLNENPCQYVSRKVIEQIPTWQPRDRWLNKYSPDEESNLFAAFNDHGYHLAAIARIMLNTGVRPGELLRVKKVHVNLSDKARYYKIDGKTDILLQPESLLIEKGKSGKPRVLPLNAPARDVMKVLIDDKTTGEWLFTNRKGEPIKCVKKGFRNAMQRAGIDSARSYDLRHTFATRLVERGVHEYVISALLGHELTASGFGSASKITPGYAHVTWDAMVVAVKTLEGPSPTIVKLGEKSYDKITTNGEILKVAM